MYLIRSVLHLQCRHWINTKLPIAKNELSWVCSFEWCVLVSVQFSWNWKKCLFVTRFDGFVNDNKSVYILSISYSCLTIQATSGMRSTLGPEIRSRQRYSHNTCYKTSCTVICSNNQTSKFKVRFMTTMF